MKLIAVLSLCAISSVFCSAQNYQEALSNTIVHAHYVPVFPAQDGVYPGTVATRCKEDAKKNYYTFTPTNLSKADVPVTPKNAAFPGITRSNNVNVSAFLSGLASLLSGASINAQAKVNTTATYQQLTATGSQLAEDPSTLASKPDIIAKYVENKANGCSTYVVTIALSTESIDFQTTADTGVIGSLQTSSGGTLPQCDQTTNPGSVAPQGGVAPATSTGPAANPATTSGLNAGGAVCVQGGNHLVLKTSTPLVFAVQLFKITGMTNTQQAQTKPELPKPHSSAARMPDKTPLI